jgi:hypothetical protein
MAVRFGSWQGENFCAFSGVLNGLLERQTVDHNHLLAKRRMRGAISPRLLLLFIYGEVRREEYMHRLIQQLRDGVHFVRKWEV